MSAGHLAHEKDDRHDHQGRCHDGRLSTDHSREGMAHHPPACGHQHEEECAEQFRAQTTPLLVRVVEIVDSIDNVLLVTGKRALCR
jgi:hypothetical protein